MAKMAQMTKVIINGVDVSNYVSKVTIERQPGWANTAEVTFFVDKIETDKEGLMTITVDTRPEEER